MKKKPSMLRRFAAYFAPHKGLFIADNAAGVALLGRAKHQSQK